MDEVLHGLVVLGGVGQLLLCAASLAIPGALGWRRELLKVRPLTRQVFWVYAGYIWTTNLAFGVVSAFAANALLSGTVLAACVTGFMTAYWLSRLLIQFLWFDMSEAPAGAHMRTAEAALVLLFVYLALVYGWATVGNLS